MVDDTKIYDRAMTRRRRRDGQMFWSQSCLVFQHQIIPGRASFRDSPRLPVPRFSMNTDADQCLANLQSNSRKKPSVVYRRPAGR